MDSAANDNIEFHKHFQKFVNFYQNFYSKKETRPMPHFAKPDMKRCPISHVIARVIPSNTCKQEMLGDQKGRETRTGLQSYKRNKKQESP